MLLSHSVSNQASKTNKINKKSHTIESKFNSTCMANLFGPQFFSSNFTSICADVQILHPVNLINPYTIRTCC